MSIALETAYLGKRYGRHWALRDCAITLPTGRVAALVGPNGAGKTTLLHMAVGLLRPTEGWVKVFGCLPHEHSRELLTRVGFVAQNPSLYRDFSVADLLTLGRKLNARWDQQAAVERLRMLGIPLERRVGKLSGGQQSQVELAKRPDLMLLDEPLASLDPLARRNFLRVVMSAATEDGMTVMLSSHIITDLERVCDYLVLLSASHVQLIGDIEEIVSSHKWLVGPRTDADAVASVHISFDLDKECLFEGIEIIGMCHKVNLPGTNHVQSQLCLVVSPSQGLHSDLMRLHVHVGHPGAGNHLRLVNRETLSVCQMQLQGRQPD